MHKSDEGDTANVSVDKLGSSSFAEALPTKVAICKEASATNVVPETDDVQLHGIELSILEFYLQLLIEHRFRLLDAVFSRPESLSCVSPLSRELQKTLDQGFYYLSCVQGILQQLKLKLQCLNDIDLPVDSTLRARIALTNFLELFFNFAKFNGDSNERSTFTTYRESYNLLMHTLKALKRRADPSTDESVGTSSFALPARATACVEKSVALLVLILDFKTRIILEAFAEELADPDIEQLVIQLFPQRSETSDIGILYTDSFEKDLYLNVAQSNYEAAYTERSTLMRRISRRLSHVSNTSDHNGGREDVLIKLNGIFNRIDFEHQVFNFLKGFSASLDPPVLYTLPKLLRERNSICVVPTFDQTEISQSDVSEPKIPPSIIRKMLQELDDEAFDAVILGTDPFVKKFLDTRKWEDGVQERPPKLASNDSEFTKVPVIEAESQSPGTEKIVQSPKDKAVEGGMATESAEDPEALCSLAKTSAEASAVIETGIVMTQENVNRRFTPSPPFSVSNDSISITDDFFDNSFDGSIHLYGPKRRRRSSVGKKIFFTAEETRNLIEGYNRYGNRWKLILESFDFHEKRTAVDLKDKARNLKKAELLQ